MKNKSRADEFDKNLGKLVRLARSEAKLSQADLADILDVSFQQVQKYENGLNRISASKIAKLSKSLDKPISYFFEEIDDYQDIPLKDRQLQLMIGLYKELSADQKQSLVKFLRGIIEHQED